MIKGNPELIARRREEIVDACERLYQEKSFREITLKDIGSITSFSRPTIYNYFQTKEEIFLALFEREYEKWNEALSEILVGNESLGKSELAEKLSRTLADRMQLLKLLSMNNYDMEENSRPELLTAYKKAYGASINNVRALLEKFSPEMDGAEIQGFIYVFFPFMYGLYPYGAVTEKQKTAMKEADVDFEYHSVYDLAYSCLTRLLGGKGGK